MKYSLTLFFLFIFYFSNAQTEKNRIKIGAQVMRTPYLKKAGFGYHGEYEFSFGSRYSASIGFGQAVGREINEYEGSVDNFFSHTNIEGVNYLEVSILARLLNNGERNHFKLGSGFTLQSIWVEYAETINFVGGVVQDIVEKRKTSNIVIANFSIQNDFHFTSAVFLTTKFIFKMPIYFPEDSGFSRSVPNFGRSGRTTRGARIHMTGILILGVGYRF